MFHRRNKSQLWAPRNQCTSSVIQFSFNLPTFVIFSHHEHDQRTTSLAGTVLTSPPPPFQSHPTSHLTMRSRDAQSKAELRHLSLALPGRQCDPKFSEHLQAQSERSEHPPSTDPKTNTSVHQPGYSIDSSSNPGSPSVPPI